MKAFTIVRRGFDPSEVEQYIRELEASLNKKEQQLKEYQAKETAIMKAVVDAQLMADSIVKTADDEANTLKKEVAAELEAVKQRVSALRQNLIGFQQEYNRILQQYLVSVRCTDMVEIFDRLDSLLGKLGTKKEDLPPIPDSSEEPAVELTDLGMEG